MKTILNIILITISAQLSGQQSFIQAGRSISSFDYKNSEGQRLENLQSTSENFVVGGFRKSFNEYSRFYYSVGASFYKYGSLGSDDTYGNYFQWETNYFGILGGLDFEFLRDRKLKMNINTRISPEFMVHGTQVLNNEVFDLKGKEEFKGPILFTRGGISINYCLSSTVALNVMYSGGKSIRITPGSDTEELKYISHDFGVGLLISLGDCRDCFMNYFK